MPSLDCARFSWIISTERTKESTLYIYNIYIIYDIYNTYLLYILYTYISYLVNVRAAKTVKNKTSCSLQIEAANRSFLWKKLLQSLFDKVAGLK